MVFLADHQNVLCYGTVPKNRWSENNSINRAPLRQEPEEKTIPGSSHQTLNDQIADTRNTVQVQAVKE